MTITRQQQHETVTTTTTVWVHLILHVSQIWALQHSAIFVDSFLLLLLLLFMLFFWLFIFHCASTITDEQQENYTTTATYRYIYRNCFIFFGSITGQQQYEMVTTTTAHSDLHKLLSVQELIFPIQQQNMNTSSEKLMLICTHHLIIGGYMWALHLTSWPSWTLHLKTWPNSAVCDLLGPFIWKLDLILLSVHIILFGGYIWQLIWVLHLTSWPSCALHLKTLPNSAVCFKWALTDAIDQWRLHLLSLAVLCGGWGISESLSGYFIWKFEHTCHFMLCFTAGLFILHTKYLIMVCNGVAWMYSQLAGEGVMV